MASDAWGEVRLQDFVSLQRGHDLPERMRRPGSVPVLGSFGLTGWHDTARCEGPGVTVGRSGASFGVVTYSAVAFWPLNTALYVTDFKGNDRRFAYYLLRQLDFKLYNSGSAQPSLNRNLIYAIPVRVPPLGEQHAIGHILGALDDKIELNHQMNRTLNDLARTLFRSWFLDFDPVIAKVVGRQTPWMNPSEATLFPDDFLESDRGPIPRGWRIAPFSEVVTILSGGTPKTAVPEYWNGTIPWFSVVDTPDRDGVFVLDTEKKITERGLKESAAQLLEEGTTIITARGTVGNVALVGKPMAMNQSCYGLIGKRGFGPYFVYYAALELVEELLQRAHGSVFDTITRATFDSVLVVEPAIGVATVFEHRVQPILRRIRANLEESLTLIAVRELLAPRLFSGEIRLRQAETLVGQAV